MVSRVAQELVVVEEFSGGFVHDDKCMMYVSFNAGETCGGLGKFGLSSRLGAVGRRGMMGGLKICFGACVVGQGSE
jgi:hypothetical protein